MKSHKKIVLLTLSLATLSMTACKKSFLERKPTDQAATEDVFKSIEGAQAAVQGMNRLIYQIGDVTDNFSFLSQSLTYDLMGEDMPINSFGSNWFVQEVRYVAARAAIENGEYSWPLYYKFVNNANFILANIDGIVADQGAKDMVKAQALSYRAWAYFNLCRLYQHTYKATVSGTGTKWPGPVTKAPAVPLYTAPTQTPAPRASMEVVYKQITDDLTAAIALFDGSGMSRSTKSEIDGNVARGIYARVALEMQDWDKAATYAKEARAGFTYMTPADIGAGFNSVGNAEWIWGSAMNTEQSAPWYSFLAQMDQDNGMHSSRQQKMINRQLYNKYLDTTGDARKVWWTKTGDEAAGYVPYSQRKFRAVTKGGYVGDFPLMRASEMALTEAEALAQQNKIAEAAAVFNEFVQSRRPSYNAPTSSADTLIKEIWIQRRIELWGEGFRYFDIKRQQATFAAVKLAPNQIGLVRTVAQGHIVSIVGSANMNFGQFSPSFLWRIPGSELLANKNIGTADQNP
ncbi:RagB/SusD family nutrient uptake outer membrane protein [Taibaiella koreensis]|uniref:RagB/SusD family nutrient uptake outer membrane protein n=1 Tax=Taibaiella koreensis TaxID=1268548 RepID=UPI000E59AE81|nr:RagB/SusD family nutrient uptake outer membrane protein [Taibaiella koreensis]